MINLKRSGCAILMGMTLLTTAIPVFAGSNNKLVYFNAYKAFGSEYVAFVEGPLTIQDNITYTFTLSGTQKSKAAFTYRAGVDDDGEVVSGTLNSTKGYSKSGTNVSCGCGNTYAYAEMDIEGTTYRIEATD